MGFDEINGNERVREYLKRAFESGTVPHALLLSGPEGSGKIQIAKLIAMAFVCQGESPPCGECSACKKALSDLHPDILVTDNGDKSIKVDEVREIRKNAFILPNDGTKKVYIICRADNMTTEAQDALLKILEEPPRFTAFILLCYNHNSLLSTVLSRVTHLKLYPSYDVFHDPESEIFKHAVEIAKRIEIGQELSIFEYMISIEKLSREELDAVLGMLTSILRDVAMKISGVTGSQMILSTSDTVSKLASKLSMQDVLRLCEAIEEAERLIAQNVGCAHITAMLACKFFRAIT